MESSPGAYKMPEKFIAVTVFRAIAFNILLLFLLALLLQFFAKYCVESFDAENRCFGNMRNIKEYYVKGILNSSVMSIDAKSLKIIYRESASNNFYRNYSILHCPIDNYETYRILKLNDADCMVFCPVHGFFNNAIVNLNTIDNKKEYFAKSCAAGSMNADSYEIEFKDARTVEKSYNGDKYDFFIYDLFLRLSIVYILNMSILTFFYIIIRLNLDRYSLVAFIVNLLLGGIVIGGIQGAVFMIVILFIGMIIFRKMILMGI